MLTKRVLSQYEGHNKNFCCWQSSNADSSSWLIWCHHGWWYSFWGALSSMCWGSFYRCVQTGGRIMHWQSWWQQCHCNVLLSQSWLIFVDDVHVHLKVPIIPLWEKQSWRLSFFHNGENAKSDVQKPSYFGPKFGHVDSANSLAWSVCGLQPYLSLNGQMSMIHDSSWIIYTTNLYGKYQLDCIIWNSTCPLLYHIRLSWDNWEYLNCKQFHCTFALWWIFLSSLYNILFYFNASHQK